jgi:glucose-6-phosphate 1-epimerase
MKLATSASIIRRQGIDILVINNSFANAQVSLLGAHVLSYKPASDHRDRLWLSEAADLDGQHAIRGGVPICWPWFSNLNSNSHGQGDADLPAHGYVRKQIWQVTQCSDTDTGTQITLEPGTAEGKGFDGHAKLQMKLFVGETLCMQLITTNIGAKSFSYTAALHSYLAIGDIDQVRLLGLSGNYLDKTRQGGSYPSPEPYVIEQETDRIHLCTVKKVDINHALGSTAVTSDGHDCWVVWNPWQDNSISMADMTDTGFKHMLCVETAITQGQTLAPGEQHILQQVIT